MNSVRGIFIFVSIPFTLLALFMMIMDLAFASGSSSSGSLVFVLCGGVYIYGSIVALRGNLPLSSLVFVGTILNIIGACAWIPQARFSNGKLLGIIGAGLTLAWISTIIREYRDESH
jgi:hypothetical protein